MVFAEYILHAARIVTSVYDGAITSGSGNTFVDEECTERIDTFKDGTVVFTSGSAKWEVRKIEQHSNGTFVYSGSAANIAPNDTYSAIYPEFSTNELITTCRTAISNVFIPKLSEQEIVNGECTLSEGVSNVKRVIIDDLINYHWEERDKKLYFDNKSLNTKCKVWYLSSITPNNTTEEIEAYIDKHYIGWAAAALLWRNKIQRIRKDNPVSVEMLNEAKANEIEAYQRMSRYAPAILTRDARGGNY